MKNKEKYLTNFSEAKRKKATQKYNIIKPFILGEQSLSSISKSKGIALSTLYRWNKSYKEQGLKGLIYATRADKGTRKIEPKIIDEIERLALMNKRNSIATIHRKITNYCKENNFDIPSYKQIYSVIKAMPKSVIDFSHQGEKYYQNKYDLIQIRESSRPNEIWQADHTLLDIFILDQKGNINRPWLTIIMDDYSRAIAGYFLSFDAPNAQNTALTLHQAIWNKNDTNWPVCGIPEKFYTDHGSDFTSHHMEQVAIDLKINLMFSKVGVPRGRGKIERFFQTVNQTFLEQLPGYINNNDTPSNLINFHNFEEKLRYFLIEDYNQKEHSTIHTTPISRWNSNHFFPNMPSSLEQLDLLLLEIPKSRKVHSDGIHFQGFRYNLAAYVGWEDLASKTTDDILSVDKIFYTAPAEKQTKLRNDLYSITASIDLGQKLHVVNKYGHEHSKHYSDMFKYIDLIIVDEIDRLKVQHLEQLRAIYDEHNLAMIFIGMPGIEKKLSRYPQLYSRIGFAHEFDNLSKDETHHILEYKWQDLGFDLKLEDFTDYEAITTIIKITKGNFRLIHRLFAQIDRIMDINGLDKISTEVVETARDSLVIGIR